VGGADGAGNFFPRKVFRIHSRIEIRPAEIHRIRAAEKRRLQGISPAYGAQKLRLFHKIPPSHISMHHSITFCRKRKDFFQKTWNYFSLLLIV
jgi:hypothetical protein